MSTSLNAAREHLVDRHSAYMTPVDEHGKSQSVACLYTFHVVNAVNCSLYLCHCCFDVYFMMHFAALKPYFLVHVFGDFQPSCRSSERHAGFSVHGTQVL